MNRPCYRSRLFWFGLPGLVFLLWAWGRSNSLSTHTTIQSGFLRSSHGKLFWYAPSETMKHPIQVDFREGDVEVLEQFFISMPGVRVPSGRTTIEPVPATERRWFPPLRWRSKSFGAGASVRFLSLPYWLMTLGYTCLWLGAVAGWQRREARLSRRAAAELPGA